MSLRREQHFFKGASPQVRGLVPFFVSPFSAGDSAALTFSLGVEQRVEHDSRVRSSAAQRRADPRLSPPA